MSVSVGKRTPRIDLDRHSRQIRRRAIWCGIVFALAVLFTVLNCLPPVSIRYEVAGNVLLDSRRVEGLVRNLKRATQGTDSARLQDFQVLDRTRPEPTSATANPPWIFLNIQSLWNQRCDVDKFEAWIDELTRKEEPSVPDPHLADSLRMAQWELVVAEHYRHHHEFLASTALASESASGQPSSAFQLVATPIRTNDASLLMEDSQIQQGLNDLVLAASNRVDDLQTEANSRIESKLGKINGVDRLTVTARAERIPLGIAVSVIVVGLATGASAGLVHLRLQSGGAYNPQDVVQLLESSGLKTVAEIQLPADQIESSDWLEIASRQAASAGRKTARNLIALSEWALGFWCVLIVARFTFDPLWRSILADSPLAAFGRLLSGMP